MNLVLKGSQQAVPLEMMDSINLQARNQKILKENLCEKEVFARR